tara:strand:- start:15886 stop:16713 length:828 start_codon:yes stop_codon:yes gene_type:complete
MSLIYRLKIFLLRVIGYEKPLRVAILKYFTIKFRQFRPHYETIMLESAIEAKKLNYDEITFIELGVAGGNGIVALEKYKTKIQKIYNIKIKIFGFDYGEGLPNSENTFDLKYAIGEGDYKIDKNKLSEKVGTKIFFGDAKDSLDEFVRCNPKNIMGIFFDMDFYTSTKNFLDQLPKFEKFLTPRVYCYFDDVFHDNLCVDEHSGERLAIKEFNKKNTKTKIGYSLDHINNFRFPLGKNLIYIMHNFEHKDYNKYIGIDNSESLGLDDNKTRAKIF